MRGKVTNGRMTARATCDATRRALIPGRPTAIATTMEGMRPRSLVSSRRTTGFILEKYVSLRQDDWME